MHLRWNPHPLTSTLHSAREVVRSTSVLDSALQRALRKPAKELAGWAKAVGLDEERFWAELIPLASRSDSHRALAENTLVKLRGRGQFDPTTTAALAGQITAVVQAASAAPEAAAMTRALLDSYEEYLRSSDKQLTDARRKIVDHLGNRPRTSFGMQEFAAGLSDVSSPTLERTLSELVSAGILEVQGQDIRARYVLNVAESDRARQVFPSPAEELRLRVGPLRELWEGKGPGILFHLREWLGDEILPAEAEILPVHPLCGGGGEAHIAYNSVRIEAVLTNVSPQLPETVRLGWLLGQLQLEIPHFSEGLYPKTLPAVGALAMVLPALTAAQEVELARCDEATLQTAWQLWRLDRFAPATFATRLRDWWQVYLDSRPPFRTALFALAQLLSQ